MLKALNLRTLSLKISAVALATICAGAAQSSTNPGVYTLDWSTTSEQLTYRSCGCADSCWVAELRARKSKSLIARLRCDCSTLYIRFPANGAEREYADTCSAINDGPNKWSAISEEMERIVHGSPSK